MINIFLQFEIVPMPLMEYLLLAVESFDLPGFHGLMNIFKLVKVDILRPLVQGLIVYVVSVPLIVKEVLLFKREIVGQDYHMDV